MKVSLTYFLTGFSLYQTHHVNADEKDSGGISNSLRNPIVTSCIDKNDYRYDNNHTQTCAWLRNDESRRQDLCQNEEVVSNCPVSCGHCCEDDSKYIFVDSMNKRTRCEWISIYLPILQEKYCSSWQNGHYVRDVCPKSCDFCTTKVISSTINPPSALVVSTTSTTDTEVSTDAPIVCSNNKDYKYEEISSQSCKWIQTDMMAI